MADLLLELGAEEIPAGFLDRACAHLAQHAQKQLAAAGLSPGKVERAATPRRIAIWVGGLAAGTEEVREEKVGPRAAAAFKDGKPTIVAEKFAQSLGLTVEQLETREVKKGKQTAEYLVGTKVVPGRSAEAILAEEIPGWIESIPFKKSMRWVPGSRLRFTRPLRRITALLGERVIETAYNGVKSGNQIEGHRFLHPEPLTLKSADWQAYLQLLREHHVIADPAARRQAIVEGLRQHLEPEQLEARARLVDEVTNLVEWPVVDVAEFAEKFLELPEVVVVDAMVSHQRYFPIRAGGELAPRFAFVANRPADAVIREGNQRVLDARLSDALFFFQLDQKRSLNDRVADLDDVVFMQELGSYRERIERIDSLALAVAEAIGLLADASGPSTPREKTRTFGPQDKLGMRIRQAARLARTDLTTEVVQEFPGLQGQIGTIYARLQGEPEEVAAALEEAYLPRGDGDALPQTPIGTCLSLADKLDTVVCAFATGRKPTGSKDPFMVRRNVLGILRILGERELDCGYASLVRTAVAGLPKELRSDTLAGEVCDYMRDRLEVMADKDRGYQITHVRAALGSGCEPSNVVDFWVRLAALETLAQDPRFADLCTLVERCRNITEKNGVDVRAEDVDDSRLDHPAEQALFAAIQELRPKVAALIDSRDYARAGAAYVEALAEVVHTFFEPAPTGVFVMDEDPRLRANRLALLKQVHGMLARGFVDLAEVPHKA
ncbi:MAG: glycine--tRNA ligase subunit beta [Planctomycetota bacterium]